MELSLQKGSRSRILAALLFLMIAIFIGRLFYLQIIKHDEYVKLAEAEQIKPLIIPAKRGEIYAQDSGDLVPLVMNQTVYTLFADPVTVTEPEKVLEVVREIAGGNLRPKTKDLLDRKDTRYQILGTKLTRQQAELIKKESLSGIGFQAVSQRIYPEGGLAAQTLGFVNDEGIGQYGVEEALDERLVGHDGLLESVTDVSGVPLTIGDKNTKKPAKNGDNIVLTIDRNIQAYTEKALASGIKKLGADEGSVIVMDPQNGNIMAMANVPTYNPKNFTKVKNAAVFNNNVTSRPYEPGSVMKTFTMAIGIDKGVINPSSTYVNTDSIRVDDKVIYNLWRGETGKITMQTGLNYSLNTSVVTVAQRLGDGKSITRSARDTMYDYLHNNFRLDDVTGVELAGEQPGVIIPPTEVEGNAVRYSNMTFGQGMNLTMIQVASAFCSLINGGTYYQPTVVAGTVTDTGEFNDAPQKSSYENVISPSSSAKVHSMIRKARKAFYADNDTPGYDIGGKTGTSQTLKPGVGYTNDETIATYLGYGGNSKPRYVIMVETSGKDKYLEGNKHALPIFTDISNWLIDYLKLQPKG